MTNIDVFYQGEGIEISHIEITDANTTFAMLKALLADRHGIIDAILFIEDEDEPVDEAYRMTSKPRMHSRKGEREGPSEVERQKTNHRIMLATLEMFASAVSL